MARKKNRRLITGLDIGTTKIVALIGEVDENQNVRIIGIGKNASEGLKRGVVVNIESTIASIRKAVEVAESNAGCKAGVAFTGIAGAHIKSLNSHGVVAVRNEQVKHSDIDRVIEAAKAVCIPLDQRVLHIIPQEFIIDHQKEIKDPIDMWGVRLEARVHIITGAVSAAQNIVRCVQQCGLQVGDIILEQLASSESVLTQDEKELGVCIVDIGGGTTDIALFVKGQLRYTAVIPIAGDQVTNDISVALRTTKQHANALKLKHASCVPTDTEENNTLIELPGVAGRPSKQVSKSLLTEVVSARYEELFHLVLSEIQRSGLEHFIPAGIVLTGGGAAVKGGAALAASIFNMPVRIGVPQHVSGLPDAIKNPIYATGVGLLLCGYERHNEVLLKKEHSSNAKKIWNRMCQWFKRNF